MCAAGGGRARGAALAAHAHRVALHGARHRAPLHQDLQHDRHLRLLRQADAIRLRAQVQGVQVQVPQVTITTLYYAYISRRRRLLLKRLKSRTLISAYTLSIINHQKLTTGLHNI